jgi:hypothetical protein
MNGLLEPNELKFLEITKELIGDYQNNEIIFDILDKCTKRQIKKENFIEKFPDFFQCLHRKMFRLILPSEYSTTRGFLSESERELTISPLIDPKLITRALMRGYQFVKPKLEELARINGMDLSELNNIKELGITIVLIILARANINAKFSG